MEAVDCGKRIKCFDIYKYSLNLDCKMLKTNKAILSWIYMAVLLCCGCRGIPHTIPSVATNEDDYSLLQDQITNDYRHVNSVLRFIYDEKYNNTQLHYKIYAVDGSLVYSDADEAFTIRYGRNYIALQLDKTTFSAWALLNPLLLEVTNAKNQKQYLKFNYSL
jgi:hypothetical protein